MKPTTTHGSSTPKFFKTAAAFEKWLATNHAKKTELLVGFYKKGSGRASLTWPESVDCALCYGWIDGVRKSVDEHSYTIRFTPRRSNSTWSNVNIARVQVMVEQGRMQPAGLRAFEARCDDKSGQYSYEQRILDLPEPYLSELRTVPTADKFFHAQPASYRRAVVWWIVSAKRDQTRQRRLQKLIDCCVEHERIPQFVSPPGKGRTVQ